LKVKLTFLNGEIALAQKFRFSTDTQSDSIENELGVKDRNIIYNNLVETDEPHIQLLKTVSIDYEITNISRAILYELDRHVIGNFPVDSNLENIIGYERGIFFNEQNNPIIKSTRYTIGKIINDDKLFYILKILKDINIDEIVSGTSYDLMETIVFDYFFKPTFWNELDDDNKNNFLLDRIKELQRIRNLKEKNWTNDKIKELGINDSLLCNITGNMTGLCLKNFLKLRLQNNVYKPMKLLAEEMYKAIPNNLKYLFQPAIYKKLDINEYDILEYLQDLEKNKNRDKLIELFSKYLVEKKYLIEDK
jgi:hypothetical protein